jgi:hypothetical protein
VWKRKQGGKEKVDTGGVKGRIFGPEVPDRLGAFFCRVVTWSSGWIAGESLEY